MKTALVYLFLMLPGILLAQNILNMTGNPTATAIVAYSVRQLSTAYTGYAIQVRRSSDNTTENIGFTSAGDLDTATLKAFVGSGTGYVTCWYDQSGNAYNATQGTAADQPTIMTSGVINRENGQPSIYTSGAAGFLTYGPVTALNNTIPITRMEVAQSRVDAFSIIEGLGHYQLDLQLYPDSIWVQYETGNIVASSGSMATTSTLMSVNSVRNNGACQLYVNTTLLGSATAGIMNFASPVMGYIGVRFDYVEGNAQSGAFSETILFNSVLSAADRQAINYNENWYYSLGFAACSSTTDTLSANGTTTKALYACTLGTPSWAYYYDPANPLKLLFGIEKDPGNAGANPTFVVDSVNLTTTSNPETSTIAYIGATDQDAIFALGRYWNVYTHTPLTSPVNIRFFYNPADTVLAYNSALSFKNIFSLSSMSNLEWFKTVGNPFAYDSLTATPIPMVKGPFVNLTPVYGTLNGINYAEFDGVTSFSGGTGVYIISNTIVTLPIVIGSISGQCVNNTVLLTWTTQSESNSLRFDVQRSADGSTWEQIGQVGAAGNSSTATSYSFTDASPLNSPDNNYYRLRLVDADGQDVYSGVVLVGRCNSTGVTPQLFKVAPNPFGSNMEITCTIPNDGPVEVQVQDMTGATVVRQKYTATRGNNVFSLTNLNNLAKGTYVVLVVQESVVGIGKVIKE
jgi:hypothetical protein